MNINKFTQKSAEALNNCEKLAYEYGNQEVDQEHLLYSLLTIEDSLIAKLVEKMEIHLPSFIERARKALEQKTKVSGDVQLMISQSLNKVLVSAEDEAKKMGDEYVSVEHIFLTLIAYPNNAVKAIFKEYGIEHGMVNLGGNVQTLGTKTDGTAWRVAIQSPQGGNQYLGILETSDQAVITSGGYERYFEENGVTYHHIIDPKTGYPSDSDLTSVTIVCADGTKADALSTSFFVMGLQKAESFYENTDLDFDVILLTKDNQIYISEGIAQNFTSDYTVNVLKK